MSPLRTFRLMLGLLLGVVALPLGLSGCSFAVNSTPTISAEDFATQVGDAVVKQLDIPRPVISCGTEQIEVVEGKVVHCDFSSKDDPASVYDSQTTISDVHGSDFHIETQIDDAPKAG